MSENLVSENRNLIIGSNSFLGNTLSRKLSDYGQLVEGLYHVNTYNLFPGIKHFPVSEMDHMDDCYDRVFIVSAFVPSKSSEKVRERLNEVNVRLVRQVCNKFHRAKIIFCSSVSVYGTLPHVKDERSELRPTSLYAISKMQGEQIIEKHPKFAIVRISSIYGRHMKTDTFLPSIIKQALEFKKIKIFGNGSRMQNYIHVEDVANYLIAAADYAENGKFLAVGNRSTSNLDIAKMVSLETNNAEIVLTDADETASFVYNNDYTKSVLQTEASQAFSIGITELVEWIGKQ